MEDVLTLWKMGVVLVTRIKLADVLETKQGLKLGAYKNFQVRNLTREKYNVIQKTKKIL